MDPAWLIGTAAARIDTGAAGFPRPWAVALATGIVDVRGRFEFRGDSISIVDTGGKTVVRSRDTIARLISKRIKGCNSSEIGSVLGYHYGDEVIHRNTLVVL